MTLPDNIPVFLLSGFLGSGKSTLLNQLLEDPAFHDTAIVINEFGDVPVDHLLVRQGETSISQVSTGCLCCSGSTDLTKTLFDLHFAAVNGHTGPFSRVIVEMSGLGDPAPLVNAITKSSGANRSMLDQSISNIFYLAGFVTLFDIINGADTLDNHFEALKQIAFADRIVLSKTDRLEAQSSVSQINNISTELSELNTSADIIDRKEVVLSELFIPRPYSTLKQGEDVAGWLALEEAISADPAQHAHDGQAQVSASRHSSAIRTFSIVREKPLIEKQFLQFLKVLQNSAGPRLLRVKGIVSTHEHPDQPLIIHAVQHIIADPVLLDTWPDEDRRTRLVFIMAGVDPQPVKDLFTAIVKTDEPSSGSFFQKLSQQVVGLFKDRHPAHTDIKGE